MSRPHNLPAASNPAALRASPSSEDSVPLLASEDGGGAPLYPHDAQTVPNGEEPLAPTQLVPWGLVEPYRSSTGYRVQRVDAADRVNRGVRTSERWLAASLDGGAVAYGDTPDEAVEELRWARVRKPLVLTPVPPAFRGRRADNDVELEVVR